MPFFSRESSGNLRMLSFYGMNMGRRRFRGNLVRKFPGALLSNYSMKVTLVEKIEKKIMHKP